jgi:hypothetical protein
MREREEEGKRVLGARKRLSSIAATPHPPPAGGDAGEGGK